MDEIFIAIGLIIFAGLVAIELKITSAIFEIIAGCIAVNFFNFSSAEVINVLADFGILALMFFAGLEIDFDVLKKNAKSSMVIGSASFLSPFLAVYFITLHFMDFSYEQALLTGIALSTTSIAIVYPTLLKSKERLDDTGKKILSAAMVVDLLSMIAISLLFSDLTILTIGFILAFTVFSYFVPSLGKKIFIHYKGNAVEFEFKIILFLILGIGIAGEAIGIETVLLAFILGVITSGVIVGHIKLWDKLRGITFGFLAPIFFFKVGTAVNLAALYENTILILLFVAICFTSKYIGTYIATKRYLPEQAAYIATIFNSRLSLGIVAATVGYELGIFHEGIYAAIIGAVILSSVIASVLTKHICKA
ncbi:MAG: cation:proton antiporter [Methanosarcinales archaeon]|nr:cation:proton antiporter [Methanosarcinales archaeon]